MDPERIGGGTFGRFLLMAAMTKLPLSYAYPFTSLSFVFVLLLSWPFLTNP